MRYFLVSHAEAHAASEVVWNRQDQLDIPRSVFNSSSLGMYVCVSCNDQRGETLFKGALDILEVEYEESNEPPASPWTDGLFVD